MLVIPIMLRAGALPALFTAVSPLSVHNAQHTVGAQCVLRRLPAYHASGTGEGLSTSSSAMEDTEDRKALSCNEPIG